MSHSTSNIEKKAFEGKIAEYNNLRNEIIHYDKLCFNILAFLFTVTGVCYTLLHIPLKADTYSGNYRTLFSKII